MSDIKYSEEEISKLGQEFMDLFKHKLKKITDEVLGEAYVNLMPHIEHDSWVNYREFLKSGLSSDYINRDFRAEWQSELRRLIFIENKDELVGLLNKDLLKRIEYLENELNLKYQRYL